MVCHNYIFPNCDECTSYILIKLLHMFTSPSQDADVQFIGNTAVYAGAAIYANDMSRCVTVDSAIGEYIIFNTSVSVKSPFFFQ